MDKELHKVSKDLKKSEKQIEHIEKLDKKRDGLVKLGKKAQLKK